MPTSYVSLLKEQVEKSSVTLWSTILKTRNLQEESQTCVRSASLGVPLRKQE